jgi:diacylglycerol kinase family enzyme
MTESSQVIPAFVNPKSGSADAARAVLEGNAAFTLREVDPAQLEDEIRQSAERGAARVLIAGGDGTIGIAVSALLDRDTELAILPGGTLNHFAGDLGIPAEPEDAIALAIGGTAKPTDIGVANDRIFLNTSSVGAYVAFVRVREYFEPRFGYRIASALAAIRVLFQLRHIVVELEVDGERRIYRTPLVFIGVGERELQLPALGKRVPDGRRGLHVLIVRGRSRARLLAVGLSAVARGVKTTSRMPELDSVIVDQCTIQMRRAGTVALDGELARLGTTVTYRLAGDAIQVVQP